MAFFILKWLFSKNDLNDLEIDLSFEDIEEMKKEEFAKIVKKVIREKAFEDLMKEKVKHSKLAHITYKELKIQHYLVDSRVESWVAKDIFKYRTRMSDVHENFQNSYSYKPNCPLCTKQKDDQIHLLKCDVLKNKCPSLLVNKNYYDIFSEDCLRIYETVRLLSKTMEIRRSLLEQEQKLQTIPQVHVILLDPSAGSWWILAVDPGGSQLWILVDPISGS